MTRTFLRRAAVAGVAALVGPMLASSAAVATPARTAATRPASVSAAPVTAAVTAGRHAAARYVAMGDSYSSGEGTGVYLSGSDTLTDRCHRSPLAYPWLRAKARKELGQLRFVACSGSVTRDLYVANHSFPSERPQLNALTPSTEAVSLTLGGNDLGFADLAAACVESPNNPGAGYGCSKQPELNTAVSVGLAALAGKSPSTTLSVPIATVLRDISRRSPKARIYLAGYPEVFGTDKKRFSKDRYAPSRASCLLNAPFEARVDYADAQWFNINARRLNTVLKQAVTKATKAGVRATFVPVPAFQGHGLCDAHASWIQPILVGSLGVRSESLHPTPVGQRQGYLPALKRAGLS